MSVDEAIAELEWHAGFCGIHDLTDATRVLVAGISELRHALSTARADALEEAALIAEKTPIPSFGSDLKWDGYEMALEDVAATIRVAKGDGA